ncbi:MAG: hypothetical protein C5S48_03655 [Candidatus Methanogaster sp.]|nr:MAG: hypothetical protein C5S48_03655 [ANME-2 cluster archaeon]
MTVDEELWPSRKSEGANISTIEDLVGVDLALAYEIKDKREKIGRVELGLVRIPIFWEWIDPATGKDTSQINYYISRLNTLIDMRNRVDAAHEELVRQAIPDFHIIRDDDVVMSHTTAIKQRGLYDELMWRIRSLSIDDDFVRELIPDFGDLLNEMYEPEENRNWATDRQKIIGMLRDRYQDWLTEVGMTYLEYLTDGGLDTFLEGVPPEDATKCERWIHSVGESYLDHLTTAETVKQNYTWLIDRKIPKIVRRFERLIDKEAKFVGRIDGGPMVDRKTRVRRSMLDHWALKFYRKMQELKSEAKIEIKMGFGTSGALAHPGEKS